MHDKPGMREEIETKLKGSGLGERMQELVKELEARMRETQDMTEAVQLLLLDSSTHSPPRAASPSNAMLHIPPLPIDPDQAREWLSTLDAAA